MVLLVSAWSVAALGRGRHNNLCGVPEVGGGGLFKGGRAPARKEARKIDATVG